MNQRLQDLASAAWRIRRYAVRMGEVQGQGYIGQALGWADVLAVAYRHAMNLRPADPAERRAERHVHQRPPRRLQPAPPSP